jgi:hypothetical protein
MDSKQRSIEEQQFEVEDWFVKALAKLPVDIRTEILEDLLSVMPNLPVIDYWEQQIYGVIPGKNIFYVIDYIKEELNNPILIDLNYVESDDYLDAILENNTIKSKYYEEEE